MKTIQKCMTKRPYTIREIASVTEAYKLMHGHSIRHLPVVDGDGETVGIITDRDVQRAMNVTKATPISQEVTLDPALRVADFMSWPVFTVLETSPLRIVMEQMLEQKVSALLVENAIGELTGIITTDDLLRVFLQEETKSGERALKFFSHYFMDPETVPAT